jgi:MFS family permease
MHFPYCFAIVCHYFITARRHNSDLGYSSVWVITQASGGSWDEPNSTLCQLGGTIRTLFYQGNTQQYCQTLALIRTCGCSIGIIGWYFLISFSLFAILAPAAGGFMGRFHKPVRIPIWGQHVYVWSISLLCALIPLPFNGYATRAGAQPDSYTCILASEWRALNAIPLIYTMCFSVFLLVYAEQRLKHIVLSFGDFKLVFRYVHGSRRCLRIMLQRDRNMRSMYLRS